MAMRANGWQFEQAFLRAERAARDARHERTRELIRRYEATGRDWRSPQRVALEHALAAHGEAVACDGWVWSYSRAEAALQRRRSLLKRHAPDLPPPRLPRVYRCDYDPRGRREDLIEMSPESVEG